MTRLEILRSLNVRPFRVLPARKLEDGINAVRHGLPPCYLDHVRGRPLLRVPRGVPRGLEGGASDPGAAED